MIDKEERKAVLKKDGRWLQNVTNRPLAYLFISSIKNTGILPNHLTFLSFILGLAAVGIMIQRYSTFRTSASILLFLSLVFDSADGQLARLKRITSSFGYWFDKITDRIKESLVIFAITYVAYNQTSRIEIWYLGIGAIFLIGFMYYNLEIIERVFAGRPGLLFQDRSVLRNLLHFGYGERIIYLSILIAVDKLIFALLLIVVGSVFHILVNSCRVIQKRGI